MLVSIEILIGFIFIFENLLEMIVYGSHHFIDREDLTKFKLFPHCSICSFFFFLNLKNHFGC
jgi:hypothetical protein